MGRDKAWVEVAGRPMIESVAAAARGIGPLRFVVRPQMPERERYAALARHLDAALIDDLHDRRGPLGGIATALTACAPGESAMILACDMPRLSHQFLALLALTHRLSTAAATVPLDPSGRPHPLASIYRRQCLPHVEAMLCRHDLTVRHLFPLISPAFLPFTDYLYINDAAQILTNINQPLTEGSE